MNQKNYKSFEKEHIQKLQQRVDKLEARNQHLTNELNLCKEPKEYPKELSKGNKTATPFPKFAPPNVATLIKGSIEAMKRYSKRLNKK